MMSPHTCKVRCFTSLGTPTHTHTHTNTHTTGGWERGGETEGGAPLTQEEPPQAARHVGGASRHAGGPPLTSNPAGDPERSPGTPCVTGAASRSSHRPHQVVPHGCAPPMVAALLLPLLLPQPAAAGAPPWLPPGPKTQMIMLCHKVIMSVCNKNHAVRTLKLTFASQHLLPQHWSPYACHCHGVWKL
jgi:hypothetical protein